MEAVVQLGDPVYIRDGTPCRGVHVVCQPVELVEVDRGCRALIHRRAPWADAVRLAEDV